MLFSFIIPVYNRPEEIEELLQSMTQFNFEAPFEVVIVEDGSSMPCEHIVEKYKNTLQISYYFKPNSGPGNSRNFGMQKAKGNYFIILDSDCILPKEYLTVVSQSLQNHYVDCFGGPDKALPTFSNIQKSINFSMTSFLTTGGIRGGSEKVDKFQPRSFNMGLSKNAFEISKGFGNIHPGEDPDLSIRLWELGLQTKLIKEAYVYHKRRIDWNKFYIQVNKFGKARPILNFWYPKYTKLTFWFPSFFLLGFILSLILIVFSLPILFYLYLAYFGMIFVSSLVQNKSVTIAVYSIIATAIQFYGYGIGYLKSFTNVFFLKKKPQEAHPELFFK
ncbi:glycosyltransferase [Flavobacterium sp. TP390]|uniref:Glycosyltransferase n=1 Tax=Flavobacterium profundi TaxID=1774945 RepID=A0A6I4IUB2_9FLAO|nr:glycosyltransferase family 2 protein [Flavobacterium profundi]MVO10481.1 glycosyltransferase [Flavobacterium profundi]